MTSLNLPADPALAAEIVRSAATAAADGPHTEYSRAARDLLEQLFRAAVGAGDATTGPPAAGAAASPGR